MLPCIECSNSGGNCRAATAQYSCRPLFYLGQTRLPCQLRPKGVADGADGCVGWCSMVFFLIWLGQLPDTLIFRITRS